MVVVKLPRREEMNELRAAMKTKLQEAGIPFHSIRRQMGPGSFVHDFVGQDCQDVD